MKNKNNKKKRIAYFFVLVFALLALRCDIVVRTYGIDTGKNGKAARVLLITDLHSSN